MMKVTTIKVATITTIILVAVLVSLLFVFVFGGEDGGKKLGSIPLPGIKLASAAQADALALAAPSLDTDTIGLLSHLDLDIDGTNPFGLQPGTGANPGFLFDVKAHLGVIGQNLDIGDNFVITRWCVPNREGCTNIRIYADSDGNIASYLGWHPQDLPQREPSARAWQAEALDINFPVLTNDNFDTVHVGGVQSPGGIKEVLGVAGLGLATPAGAGTLKDQVTWFHFGLPTADRLLMVGKALGIPGTSTVNLGLPPGVQAGVLEVSFALYSLGTTTGTTERLKLDGTTLATNRGHIQTDRQSGFVDVSNFGANPSHFMDLTMDPRASNLGSTGAVLMIIYDDPSS